MNKTVFQHVYGPVPSRRLGRSMGVDLVPFKTCTYDCVYCQLGRTTNKTMERKEYVAIEDVLAELKRKLAIGLAPDYISLAGSGEPTLNIRIGDLIGKIKGMTGIPVAVLTNGSLLWKREIRDALMEADLVLPSLDAGDEHLFQHVNRPHPGITFEAMVGGIAEFRERFRKPMWLEVFLLAGVTGIDSEVKKISALVRRIRPERVQLNTVSRPPCEEFAYSVSFWQMEVFASMFDPPAEVISPRTIESQIMAPHAVTDENILALLRRRPCTAQGVAAGLGMHIGEAIKRLDTLVEQRTVDHLRSEGEIFYAAASTTSGRRSRTRRK